MEDGSSCPRLDVWDGEKDESNHDGSGKTKFTACSKFRPAMVANIPRLDLQLVEGTAGAGIRVNGIHNRYLDRIAL